MQELIKSPKYNFMQKRNDYLTPPDALDAVFNFLSGLNIEHNGVFDLDACASQKNIPAKNYYIEGIKDGLNEPWQGLTYCNPPFNDCGKWLKKAYEEFKKGVVCCLLIPARTETAYWHKYILQNGFLCQENIDVLFLRKGLRFLNPDTHEEMGVFKNPLAIVIMNGEVCYG